MEKIQIKLVGRLIVLFGLVSFACLTSSGQSSDGAEPTPTPTPTPDALVSGGSGGETSSENEVEPESEPGETEPEISANTCLIGNWQVDNATYLAFLNTA